MITRRAALAGGAFLATLPLSEDLHADAPAFDPRSALPHKDAFFPLQGTYLNCASQHPLSRGARAAINRYLDYKTFSGDSDFSNFAVRERIIDNYAQLIGADRDEICFVQSTTVGENLILKALGIPENPARVVTDELHFVGSLPTYSELRKRGTDVAMLRANDNGSIDLEQFADAINDETRLVAVSLVSTTNGFQHDLKALCELAHAHGALVYADIIHAVGSVPFDVRDSGVDFASAASYKWLMGEMGLGFLYVRKDRLDSIERPWFGHNQLARRVSTGFPNPEPADEVTEYEHLNSALGYFAMGSQANIVAAQLDHSLDYLLTVGVDKIQAYRQPLIDRLRDELPRIGYPSITPANSTSALISFRHDGDTAGLREKLQSGRVTISGSPWHIRISPSVFNDMDDIDHLIRTLS